ncbi:peptidylprolyl isomerase [Chitinophaga sp. SYP-B3965]|uniref:FKBP-type peptidyl-prolyl cis-trans isomerase n=1 Tax=Chitinophaga sp. SYP-B3965 TaxID=2663120 RepID=UPI001299604B|nr:FKBP-type peptidyl-prolyl cis-trans isomerase [Chitinophaga sp. SYP-B3965]MRG45643.1 peptidylprolyl isomerase [Chitinophaga sp. SYP-B3965]
MKRHYFWLLSLLAITAFAACNKKDNTPPYDPVQQAATDERLITEFIAANNITGVIKDDTTALHYKILENAPAGDTIKLNDRMNITYEGKLLNGNVFDDGDKTTLNDYRLQELIEGWQIGLRKISKGGKIQLFVPSAMGYKNYPTGSIPANSVLVFVITLHNFYY